MTVIPAAHISNASVRCSADDLITRLRLVFDYDHASSQHRQAIELQASSAETRHGRKDATLDAAALLDARSAVSLGQRWLGYYSRPVWRGELTLPAHYASLRPGDEISTSYSRLPAVWVWLVTDVIAPPQSQTIRVSIEGVPGTVPTIDLLRQSSKFAPVILEPATINAQADIAEFTLRDPDGNPLVQARCTLDDAITLLTDQNGWVQFTGVSPGEHTLVVEAEGLAPMLFSWIQGG